MSRIKLNVKKGDIVKALAGDDKGKTGKVLEVLPGKSTALVEGLNYIKKHMRGTQDNPEGGIVEKEAPVHVSNLSVVSAAEKDKEASA